MKTIFIKRKLTLVILLFFCSNLNAQSLIKKVDFGKIYTNEFVIKQFSGVQSDTTAYFKFIIHENRNKSNYTLEASINGIDFITIEKKEGFKSPNTEALMYCYSINTNTYLDYKLFRVKISSEDNIDYSHTIRLYDLDRLQKESFIANEN